MHRNAKVRLMALIVVLAGAAALQGCAVTTGVYVPDRSPIVSHSMLSRFDMRYAEPTGGLATGQALHMPQHRPTGVLFFQF